MMEVLNALLGIIVTAVIFYFITTQVREEHAILKYILLVGMLVLTLFIPAYVIGGQTDCQVVVQNSTIIDANKTSYDYIQVCFNNSTQSGISSTFYTVMMYFIYAIVIYLIFWSVSKGFMELLNGLRGKKL